MPLSAQQAEPGFDAKSGTLRGKLDAGADIGAAIVLIGQLAGFEVRVQPGLGRLSRDVDLAGLTPELALGRLLRERSFVVFREADGDQSGSIRKIWVIGEGTAFETAPKPPEPEAGVPIDPSVRAAAVREVVALSYAADARARQDLRELAVGAEDPAVRRAALSALAGLDGPGNANLFLYFGLRDPDPTVRVEAARSIMRAGLFHGATALRAAAARESDDAVRDILERLARGEKVEYETGFTRTLLRH